MSLLGRINNMNHFTDSLLKDFLLEASYSEQEEKMDL